MPTWEDLNREQKIRYIKALHRLASLAVNRASSVVTITRIARDDELSDMVLSAYDKFLTDGRRAAQKVLLDRICSA